MNTEARWDLTVRRNDDVWERPLRIIGPNLTGVDMRAQIRLAGDTPGAPLADLQLVTNGNAEGVRLASATQQADGTWTNDVRIRLNKSTRQALPYAGEVGDAATLEWGFLLGGVTRIEGKVFIPAQVYGSDAAPLNRPPSYGTRTIAGPAFNPGATLAISQDGGATLAIDGADLLAPYARAAQDALDQINDFTQGPTGPANSTYPTLAKLKDADITNGSALLTAPGIGGTFLWVEGDFTGLTDDKVLVASNTTPASEGVWVKQTSEAVTTAAIVPGLGDNGPALQALLNAAAGRTLLVASRPVAYTVGDPLLPPSNTRILFEADTQFAAIGDLRGRKDRRGFFDVSGTTGVEIATRGNGETIFRAAPFNATLAAQPVESNLFAVCGLNPGGTRTTRLKVKDVRGRGVQHVYLDIGLAYEDVITPATDPVNHTCNTDIHVVRGGADNDTNPAGEPACMIRFGFDWSVRGSNYTNVSHGVAWWGGNASLDANGAPANERKCGRFEISQVTVNGSPGGGGVWGSMANKGRVIGCTALRCGDVGFDPEGSIDIDFVNCRAEDCGNANFAVFFACRGISFIGCTSIGNREGAILFQTFNVTQTAFGQDITIDGGLWVCNAENGQLMGQILVSGAQRSITIKGISARDVVITADGNNNNQVTVANNDLSYTRYSIETFVPIYVGRAHEYGDERGQMPATIIIKNNRIRSQANQQSGSVPIVTLTDDFNVPGDVEITGNDIRGGWTGPDIILRFRGQNGGVVTAHNVYDNSLRDGAGLGVDTIVNDSNSAAISAILNRGGNRRYRGGSLDPAPEPPPESPVAKAA